MVTVSVRLESDGETLQHQTPLFLTCKEPEFVVIFKLILEIVFQTL